MSNTNSVVIEMLRPGTSHNQGLSKAFKYLALCGDRPQAEFSTTIDQTDFDLQVGQLRYGKDGPAVARKAGRVLTEVVTNIFDSIPALRQEAGDAAWLHLRLIVAPKELGMLPFEFALTPRNFQGEWDRPLLINPQRLTTLTREIRQHAGRRYDWPRAPRVLFAWSDAGGRLPAAEHYNQLAAALTPWAKPFGTEPSPAPDLNPLLTKIDNATITGIRAEIGKALAEKRPYTHVHILAHGTKVEAEGGASYFALALRKEGDGGVDAVNGNRLAGALVVSQGGAEAVAPAVVTVAGCDSGNPGDIILPGASLAHALHSSGIPYVLASQFPLTHEGSVKLVELMYPRLFAGEDPRQALFHVRQELESALTDTHDWASLVSYARFPDDFEEQLEDVRLAVLMASMKTANAWTDHALKYEQRAEQTLLQVGARLDTAIQQLEWLLTLPGRIETNPARRAEHRGLLGSAYKRKAEHLWLLRRLRPEAEHAGLLSKSEKALRSARKWYKEGYESLLSHHWTGCQYLSLTAVLLGTLEEERELWTIVHHAAKRDLRPQEPSEKPEAALERQIWAHGTLGELYLLRPLAEPPAGFEAARDLWLKEARKHLCALNDYETRAADFPKESTARQLERYVKWWPETPGKEGVERLKEMSADLRNVLPPLSECTT